MKITLTNLEQVFLDKLQATELHPGHVLYWLMAKKHMERVINDKETDHGMVTDRAYEVAKSILYKIVMQEADAAIEELLQPSPTFRTKSKSYEKSKKGASSVGLAIQKAISARGELSRTELAEHTGIRLSTICGQVKRMLNEGQLIIVGSKIDKDSDREVELLGTK